MTSGVDQEVRSSRACFQSSLPVFLSSAVMKDPSSLSQFTISISLYNAGELPSPKPAAIRMSPRSLLHTSFP